MSWNTHVHSLFWAHCLRCQSLVKKKEFGPSSRKCMHCLARCKCGSSSQIVRLRLSICNFSNQTPASKKIIMLQSTERKKRLEDMKKTHASVSFSPSVSLTNRLCTHMRVFTYAVITFCALHTLVHRYTWPSTNVKKECKVHAPDDVCAQNNRVVDKMSNLLKSQEQWPESKETKQAVHKKKTC
jgi:hypothetical protein